MAGLSRAVTEAIMETRWEYFGGSINSKAPYWASKHQEEDSPAFCSSREDLGHCKFKPLTGD